MAPSTVASLGSRGRPSRGLLLGAGACGVGGIACSGPQSALETAAKDADRIASLFWWMTIGSAVIWAFVMGLAIYAVYAAPRGDARRTNRLLIIGGGVVFPTVLLAGLLAYGLTMLSDVLEPSPPGSLRVRVSGEQWWWRVQYLPASGKPVTLANEIRLPVGEAVEFELESPDVIHSFWIPALGGKVDMIPGRTTRLRLHARRTGEFRGACAEYCGTSHALMAFPVVVMPKAEFAAWLEAQARDATPPSEPLAIAGHDAFIANGCGACHAVRGTPADGTIGPDLTHVGSRLSLGAGTTPNDIAAFRSWIARTDELKPGVHMPAFGMLAPTDLGAMAAYLESLK